MEQNEKNSSRMNSSETFIFFGYREQRKFINLIFAGAIGGLLLSLATALALYELCVPPGQNNLKNFSAFLVIVSAVIPILTVNYRQQISKRYGVLFFYVITCITSASFLFWEIVELGLTTTLIYAGIGIILFIISAVGGLRWDLARRINLNSKLVYSFLPTLIALVAFGEYLSDMLLSRYGSPMGITHSTVAGVFVLFNCGEFYKIWLVLSGGRTVREWKKLHLEFLPGLFLNLLAMNLWLNAFKIILKYVFENSLTRPTISFRKILRELSR